MRKGSQQSRNPFAFPKGLACVSNELSFRSVSRQVLSPLQSLTSVFGMGTGGPSALEALTISFNEAFKESLSLKTEQSEDCVERNSSKIVELQFNLN